MPDSISLDSFKSYLDYISENNGLENAEVENFSPEIREIHQILKEQFYHKGELESKIDHFNDVLLEYAQHNYTSQIDDFDDTDVLNSFATSINLLGEELNYSTITKNYLEDVFNSMTDVLIVIDEHGYVNSVNHAFEEILGFKSKDIVRQRLNPVIRSLNFNEFKKTIRNGTTTLTSKSGKEIPFAINISGFLRGDNKEIGSIIIARDISEMLKYQKEIEERNEIITKKNQDLILALRKAEESDHLKTSFLQNISHEIRTPLNAIIGFTQLISMGGLSEEELIEYSNIIEKSSTRLIEIVNNVLDISKIETNQIELIGSLFNINPLLKDHYKIFRKEAEEKNIKLTYTECIENEGLKIFADNGKINQILSNLIKNAIKFTFKGEVNFGCTIDENEIEFYVNDSGIGIPEEVKDKIFDRFIQADNSASKDYEGAGLGLAICKGLVEVMNGKIWYEKNESLGSTFRFKVPIAFVESEDAPIDGEELDKINRKLNILIAEDDYPNYLLLEKSIDPEKHNIKRAENGLEAIKFFQKERFDIVLMDIKMPKMDGLEATKEIREIDADIPIIALSAFAFNEEKQKILSHGFTDYIAKPLRIVNLIKKIKFYTGA